MTDLAKDTLSTQIYSDLLTQIVEKKMTSGAHINARKLQKQLGTSITPIREALSRLASDGLVEYEANVGYRVVRFSRRDIWEINDMLALMDCHAVELAMQCPRADELIEALRQIVEDQQRAYDTGDEPLYRHCTEYFHDIFYEYADNKNLYEVSRRYNYRMKLMASVYESHDNRRISLREHALIYHVLKDRDVEQAMRYMRQHILETRDLLLSQYDTLFVHAK